jgi:hypothetical protein
VSQLHDPVITLSKNKTMKNLLFCAAFLCVGLLAVVVVNSKNRFKQNVQTSTHFLVNPVFGEVTAEIQQRYDSKTPLDYEYNNEVSIIYDCGNSSYKFNP